MILLGVSLAYGRDDIKSLSVVCIILTSKIGQRSERRVNGNDNGNDNDNGNITACKGNTNF